MRRPPENEQLLFAEGALCVIAFERLLRILPEVGGTQGDKLADLMRKAHDAHVLIIDSTDIKKAINKIVRVRDTTLHANYEQAANQAGLSVEQYFKTQYTSEIDLVGRILDALLGVVDLDTGAVREALKIEVPLP
jgi:Ni,Fe-hydrogenase maturation factor